MRLRDQVKDPGGSKTALFIDIALLYLIHSAT